MWLLTSLMQIYYPFFMMLMTLGMFMAISSHSWFMVWIGLEVNMYSFIPMLLHSNMHKRKESASKYFLVQALGSAMLLTATLSMPTQPMFSSFMFISSLLLKAGLAPLHFWFPSIMAISPWFSCFLLSTIQKIAPVTLLMYSFPINTQSMLILGSLMTLIGGMGGMNQTQLRSIMAYSSIGQMGWMITASQVSQKISTLMFINYIITASSIMMIFAYMEWDTSNQPNFMTGQYKTSIILLMLLIINLSGIPPFPGFIFKAMVLYKLLWINAIKTSIIIITGSIMSLYFYLKIVFNTLFSSSNKTYIKETHMSVMEAITLITMSLMSILIIMFIIPWII
uniref:NADH-ubiquinone oxidoreductase chain 2 n=1 Tax=Clymenella torquata TaxID=292503 RepID=Q642W2_CLYTO